MRDPLVLCYHSVSPSWRAVLSVAPDVLEAQLTRLLERGFRPMTFCEAVDSGPYEKALAVTFDDGYRSIREHALPVLSRLGIPGTLFVPTALMGAGRMASWPGVDGWLHSQRSELELLDWEDLAGLLESGWEIGSHSRTHCRLSDAGDADLAAELAGSREDLQERLGIPDPSIAYPYGALDARVLAAAQDVGYTLGAALPRRPHAPLRLNWPRTAIYRRDHRLRIALKTSSLVSRARSYGVTPIAPSSPADRAPGPGGREVRALPALRQPGTRRRVAVIIPCFNDGEFVLQALNSLQEREPLEVVVVDDGSSQPETLHALDRARRAEVCVVHQQNAGPAAARMRGVRETSAPFVFPLDADDLAEPYSLGRMADVLDRRSELAACFGDVLVFGREQRVGRIPHRLDPYLVAFRNRYPVASLFRRKDLVEVGGWEAGEGVAGYEDWNLWMALAEREKLGVHVGRGMLGVRYRTGERRRYADDRDRHVALYEQLRANHPDLFARLPEFRRRSFLRPAERALYPVLFGGRPPLGLRSGLDAWLARLVRPRS